MRLAGSGRPTVNSAVSDRETSGVRWAVGLARALLLRDSLALDSDSRGSDGHHGHAPRSTLPGSEQSRESSGLGVGARVLILGGATGALLQTSSFALAVTGGAVSGVLAAVGTLLSGITLVGLVVWVTARSRSPRVVSAPPVVESEVATVSAPAPESAPLTEPSPPDLAEVASEPEPEAPAPESVPSAERLPVLALAKPGDSEVPSTQPAVPAPSNVVMAASLEEIAHDINNLMTVVVTQAELLRERHVGRNPTELEPILDAANRLSGVARKLVAFAERQREQAPLPMRGPLVGPGIVRAREPLPPAREAMPSILDAVEAVRDSDSAVRESHAILSERRPVHGWRGVVLLVEDEEVLLKATRRMLEQRGFRVLSAANGPQALDHALEADQIDILVTDLSLPGMNGMELARRLRWTLPDLAVLYTSGYDAATSGLALKSGGREAFLPKPFTARELAERLTELCGLPEREPLAQPG